MFKGVCAAAVAYVVFLVIAYWALADADPMQRKLAWLHAQMRGWQRVAEYCGQKGIAVELRYHQLVEDMRTI